MAELPTFIALKSVENQKYLVYIDKATKDLPHILQCSGAKVYSKFARFKVEKDVIFPELVHIKSTYIDKYWRRANEETPWIVAGEEARKEDRELWSCTLFKPKALPPENGNIIYQFTHVKTGNLLELKSGDEVSNGLVVEQAIPTRNTAFIVKGLPE